MHVWKWVLLKLKAEISLWNVTDSTVLERFWLSIALACFFRQTSKPFCGHCIYKLWQLHNRLIKTNQSKMCEAQVFLSHTISLRVQKSNVCLSYIPVSCIMVWALMTTLVRMTLKTSLRYPLRTKKSCWQLCSSICVHKGGVQALTLSRVFWKHSEPNKASP